MSDNDAYQLANRMINDLNLVITTLRSSATTASRIITRIDNILADQPKKDVLIAGLSKANMDLGQLNTLKTTLSGVISHIHGTVPELTE